MAVMIAACRTLTAARPLALASRVSWFRFRAMPLSWAMKSSCSRVIRALTVPRSISWRRTSAGGCPASRQRAEKRSFRSGLNTSLGEELPDADIFQIIHNFCFSKFADIALLPTTFA